MIESMINNKFSVLISIYRKENPDWFKEALESIFAQTLQPTEIVLVEDGPLTPELYAVIDEYKERYPIFNIVKNETNLGLGLALRKGVEASTTEFLVRMDTDDIIPPYRFEHQMKKIVEGYDVVSCWAQLFMGSMDNVIAVKTRPENHEDIVKLAHRRSPICHAGTLFRKSALLKAGNYQHCKLYEDYHLVARLIMSGAKFYNMQEVLYYVRTTPEQMNRRSGMDYLKTEISFFKEFRKMGFFTAKDYIINCTIRIVVRLMPNTFRQKVLTKIWNHKNG
jgi:glycosyltransferase involved in cell wall biosynthesis